MGQGGSQLVKKVKRGEVLGRSPRVWHGTYRELAALLGTFKRAVFQGRLLPCPEAKKGIEPKSSRLRAQKASYDFTKRMHSRADKACRFLRPLASSQAHSRFNAKLRLN